MTTTTPATDTTHLDPRPSFLGTANPASIRFNNPGAMWPGPSSRKFGAQGVRPLDDGLGQGNKIAIFDDVVQGGAALFDLVDRAYTGLSVSEAIKKWSGGNWVPSYLDVLRDRGGINPSDMITRGKIRDPDFALRFAKAMAWHEAGKEYPMADEHWLLAHRMAFEPKLLPPKVEIPKQAVKAKMKLSRKARLLNWFRSWIVAGSSGWFGWETFKSTLGEANQIAPMVSQLASDVGWVGIAGVLFALWAGAGYVLEMIKQDISSGRYEPSGDDTQ